MSVTQIYKDHAVPRGPRKGISERYVVEPRADGAFCLKLPSVKSNRDEAYKKVFTLGEAAELTRDGWSIRMRCQTTREWNTLKAEGLHYV